MRRSSIENCKHCEGNVIRKIYGLILGKDVRKMALKEEKLLRIEKTTKDERILRREKDFLSCDWPIKTI